MPFAHTMASRCSDARPAPPSKLAKKERRFEPESGVTQVVRGEPAREWTARRFPGSEIGMSILAGCSEDMRRKAPPHSALLKTSAPSRSRFGADTGRLRKTRVLHGGRGSVQTN